MSSSASAAASVVFEQQFEVIERVFSEGNQAAYLARDRVRGEDVLLFLVPPARRLAPATDALLRASIEKAFEVAAPSLLPVLDLRSSDEHRFLVMPRPGGTNAWARLSDRNAKRLTPDAACAVADDLLLAAKAAHRGGALFGCSPKQVWIQPEGGAEAQFFWIGRERGDAPDPALLASGAEGSYFRAPELGEQRPADPAPADQYFVGALLYALLTGEVPGARLVPVRKANPDVPLPMAKAIERSLAASPAARHANLDRFRAALHRRPPRVGVLVPLFLLLLAMLGARALFGEGAATSWWEFEPARESRLADAFARLRVEPEPVPSPSPAASRFRGRYRAGDGTLVTIGERTWFAESIGSARRDPAFGLWTDAPDDATTLRLIQSDDAGGRVRYELRSTPNGLVLADRANGSKQATRKIGWFTADGPEPRPLLVLEEPLAGAIAHDGSVRVAGRTAFGPEACRVTVNGVDVSLDGRRFETTVTLGDSEPGLVLLRVEAQAEDGFTATIEREIRRPAPAPTIDWTRATLEDVEGTWFLVIEGRVPTDGSVASITVNDEAVEIASDGAFRYERRGTAAVAHAFAEIVARAPDGRLARRVAWPVVVGRPAAEIESHFAEARTALEENRLADAETALRALRKAGGWIEQIPADLLARLARSTREPRITLDPYREEPGFYENDGTRQIPLSGTLDWLGPDDRLHVGGRVVPVRGGRFDERVQVPGIGRQAIRIEVRRAGEPVARRDIEVLLADHDADFRAATGTSPHPAQVEASARFGLPLAIQNGVGMHFVLIPPGEFPRTAAGRVIPTRVTQPFYLQTTEVTRGQFEALGGHAAPRDFETRSGSRIPLGGERAPAVFVSRIDAHEFAQRLSQRESRTYRLPKEVEWEWAARAATLDGTAPWKADRSDVKGVANLADRSIKALIPTWPESRYDNAVDDGKPGPWDAGTGRANAFGAKDLFGNVAEWVGDGFAEFDPAATEDPFVPPTPSGPGVVRGGSWNDLAVHLGWATRTSLAPAERAATNGFRLVLLPEGVR